MDKALRVPVEANSRGDLIFGSKSRLKIPDLIYYVLLFTCLLAPFAVDKYKFIPHLQSISSISLLLLCFICLFLPKKNKNDLRLFWLISIVALGCIVATAMVFYYRAGGSRLSTMSSQRWFLYWLLVPILRIMVRNGAKLRDVFTCILVAAAFAVSVYTFRQFTWNLHSMAMSSDPQLHALVRSPDTSRGYRLVFPEFLFYALIATGLSFIIIAKYYNPLFVAAYVLLIILYSLTYSRQAAVWIPIGLLLALIVSNRADIKFRLLVLLFFAACATLFIYGNLKEVAEYIQYDRSGATRLETVDTIIKELPNIWITGYGADNAQLSYQLLFTKAFYPSDVGILGIAFTYGVGGVAIVFLIHLIVIRAALIARSYAASRYTEALTFAAVWCALLFLLLSGTFYSYILPDSIVIGAIIMALPNMLRSKYR